MSCMSDTWNTVRAALTAVVKAGINQANKPRRECRFKLGNWVMIRKYPRARGPQSHANSVLSPYWDGPYQTIEVISPVTFRLDLPPSAWNAAKTINASWIKPYHNSPDEPKRLFGSWGGGLYMHSTVAHVSSPICLHKYQTRVYA